MDLIAKLKVNKIINKNVMSIKNLKLIKISKATYNNSYYFLC